MSNSITVEQLFLLQTTELEPITFNKAKERLELTDGNLSSHARRLQQQAFIVKRKQFNGDVPETSYQITKKGRDYLGWVRAMIAPDERK